MNKIWALEPRIMFDGAALVTGAEMVTDQHAQTSGTTDAVPSPTTIESGDEAASETSEEFETFNSTLATLSSPSVRKEIIFIDTRVADYQTLLSGIAPGVEAVLLDPTRNGIEQLADMLRDRSDLDAIHVISHGNQSELWLGTGHLTINSMNAEHADDLAVIGRALADTGDILIYGCNFGQGIAGQEAVDRLTHLTGADVAASLDDTGSAGYGGDWDLEYQMGNIESQVALNVAMQQNWVGKLAVITVDTFADVIDATDGVTSLREAILQANAGSGGDTIVLGSGTYVLSLGSGDNNGDSGDLDILKSVTLTGAGAQSTIIDGNSLDRVFHLQNDTTVVTMSGFTIRGGLASDNGAGIFIDNSSTLNLSDATVTNNDGMGGRGGGFHVHGTLNLNRVLIANNTAAEGGGIYFHGAIGGTLTNVTLSGNNASNEGGGVWTEVPISIMNSTIAFNTASSGAGIVDKDGLDITITNSILYNPAGQNSKNFLISGGNNIDSDGTAGLGDPLDGQDPLLGPLANNGGSTQTHALQAGSPAINAGTATGAPAVDQRGVLRDANVDIGSYEVSSNLAPAVDLDADNSSGATGNDYTLTFTEGAGPISIADSDTNLTDADSTTFGSVKLAVSGLLDGNDEELLLDGTTFSLATAVVGQDTSGGKYHVVMITGAGTATVTITKQGGGTFTEIETETLIKAIQYQHTNSSTPADGDRLIDVIVNDGSTDSAAARTTLNVNPLNDPPVLITNNPLTVPEESTRTITTAYLEATDVDNTAAQLVYTLTQLPGGSGQVQLNGSTLQLGETFTQDDINNNRVTFRFSDDDESSATSFKFTLSDGTFTSPENIFSINGQATNDPPAFSGLDHTPAYTEGGPAVVLDPDATMADPELDAANNYNGAILTLVRNGGANTDDLFDGSGTLSPLVESGNVIVSGTTIGIVTANSGGTLALTFNNNATTALVNSALQQLTYVNSSANPPASVQIDFTINDGNTGSQGTGGALTAMGSITININSLNTAPIAMTDMFTVNEGSSQTLFVASNDLDPDDGLDLNSIRIISGPTHGTIDSINGDGTMKYTHDGTETLTDSFTYTIDDLSGATSNTVTVSLMITPVNDAPVITSNEGGASAHVSLTEVSTAVTQIVATDAEGDTLTYSIAGGADAALFAIDPATEELTFKIAPNAQAPGDAGADNIYDVVVQVSDGAAVATQALAVTVTNVPPAIPNPLPPVTESSPASDPQPGESETDGGTETEIEEGSESGVPFGNNSSGPWIEINHHSSETSSKTPDIPASRDLNERDETPANTLGENHDWLAIISEGLGKLRGNMDQLLSAEEIRSLLNRKEFVDDLDRIRDAFKNYTATEQIYLASGVAAASGLSVGYVIWLLRSGVLLTALLSSVPAWQFVNPLLVLNRTAHTKQTKDSDNPADDSVESLFDHSTASTGESQSKSGFIQQAQRFLRTWRHTT